MRIVAGLMVIYSHSIVLVGRPELIDSLGSYAVPVGRRPLSPRQEWAVMIRRQADQSDGIS